MRSLFHSNPLLAKCQCDYDHKLGRVKASKVRYIHGYFLFRILYRMQESEGGIMIKIKIYFLIGYYLVALAGVRFQLLAIDARIFSLRLIKAGAA